MEKSRPATNGPTRPITKSHGTTGPPPRPPETKRDEPLSTPLQRNLGTTNVNEADTRTSGTPEPRRHANNPDTRTTRTPKRPGRSRTHTASPESRVQNPNIFRCGTRRALHDRHGLDTPTNSSTRSTAPDPERSSPSVPPTATRGPPTRTNPRRPGSGERDPGVTTVDRQGRRFQAPGGWRVRPGLRRLRGLPLRGRRPRGLRPRGLRGLRLRARGLRGLGTLHR